MLSFLCCVLLIVVCHVVHFPVVIRGDPGGLPRRAPPKIGKNMIFWRKILIFHTKYTNNFRASLRSAPSLLTANPGFTPGHYIVLRYTVSGF